MDLAPWPAALALAGWQLQAADVYFEKGQRDFLCAATPGAGKTRFALYLAHWLLREGAVERLVITVPTENLKTQWRRNAAAVGIHLAANFRNHHGREARDEHGIVVTYQQVASNPEIFRIGCQRSTFVILDEPHHIGEHRRWGGAIRTAFEAARFRLSLSGTPFRSDGTAIPFIRYENGVSVPDYQYDYGDALQDGRCAYAIFPTWEGEFTWWTADGGERTATFADDLSEEEQQRRLNTAISPQGAWLPTVLKQADEQLTETRRWRDPQGAGLAIAKDTAHAQAIAALLKQAMKGTEHAEEPVLVVTHDEEDATETIERFREGYGRWLVAVRMVSEGQDIPRLVVEVYATNVTTEMHFLQALGRIIRPHAGVEDSSVHMLVPGDPRLREYIANVERLREHVLRQEEDDEDQKERQRRELTGQLGLFTPVASLAEAGDVITVGDGAFSSAEVAAAERFRTLAGIHEARIDRIAAALRAIGQEVGASGRTAPAPIGPSTAAPLEVRKQKLSTRVSAQVSKIINALSEWHLADPPGSVTYGHLNKWLNLIIGVEHRKQASYADLERLLRLTSAVLDEMGECRKPRTKAVWKERVFELGGAFGGA